MLLLADLMDQAELGRVESFEVRDCPLFQQLHSSPWRYSVVEWTIYKPWSVPIFIRSFFWTSHLDCKPFSLPCFFFFPIIISPSVSGFYYSAANCTQMDIPLELITFFFCSLRLISRCGFWVWFLLTEWTHVAHGKQWLTLVMLVTSMTRLRTVGLSYDS